MLLKPLTAAEHVCEAPAQELEWPGREVQPIEVPRLPRLCDHTDCSQ